MKKAVLSAIALCTVPALAGTANDVLVEVHGDVYYNGVNSGAFAGVTAGETVTYSFQLSSSNYIDGSFPVRGYVIDASTFSLNFSGGTTIGIQDPYPAGFQPLFVLRDNDPVADGFFITDGGVDGFPQGVSTEVAGVFGNFLAGFSVSYLGDTLNSLDITDAFGEYDYTGLTVFGMGINDGPIESVLGIDFSGMSISQIPAPSGLVVAGFGGLMVARRRR